MWKHLEQRSFPLTEEQYQEQLDAVAEMVALWGVSDAVRAGIAGGRARGPGFTAGGSARAVRALPRCRGLGLKHCRVRVEALQPAYRKSGCRPWLLS
jgi:hypothetical protein